MKNRGKHIVLSLMLLSLLFGLQGQDVKVTSAFDSTKIFIGDQVKFTITIDQPEGLKLNLPAFKDSLVKNVEILSGPVIDSAKEKGRLKIIERYLVTSFDSGHYEIPPVFAEMKNESGLKRFYSDYALLKVMRVKLAPADTTAKIFDIVGPYKAPVTVGEILPWVLLAGVLAVLAWFGWKWYKKFRQKQGEVEEIVNPDPAHVIAFRQLEKLKEEKLWQNGEIKLYYTRLTEIIRYYLENRYRIYSLELTTQETLDALVKSGFKRDATYTQLKNILTGADLVKFAKYNPEPNEHEAAFQESWNFVMATRDMNETYSATDVKDAKEEEVRS
jgi:hypothetical protein